MRRRVPRRGWTWWARRSTASASRVRATSSRPPSSTPWGCVLECALGTGRVLLHRRVSRSMVVPPRTLAGVLIRRTSGASMLHPEFAPGQVSLVQSNAGRRRPPARVRAAVACHPPRGLGAWLQFRCRSVGDRWTPGECRLGEVVRDETGIADGGADGFRAARPTRWLSLTSWARRWRGSWPRVARPQVSRSRAC
jgi:hypothetical protein